LQLIFTGQVVMQSLGFHAFTSGSKVVLMFSNSIKFSLTFLSKLKFYETDFDLKYCRNAKS